MYEFVKTETGWRVFWGIDPSSLPADAESADEKAEPLPSVLPLPQSDDELDYQPAA